MMNKTPYLDIVSLFVSFFSLPSSSLLLPFLLPHSYSKNWLDHHEETRCQELILEEAREVAEGKDAVLGGTDIV